MDSKRQEQHYSLSALFVFENTINKELIRSLHVCGLEDGTEKKIEREFLFRKRGSYVEMAATPLLRLRVFQVSELFEGRLIGLWLCIFAFDADSAPTSINIPPTLSISRNPKLKSIPKLVNDLQMVSQWSRRMEAQELSQITLQERDGMKIDYCHQSRKSPPKFSQDLNSLPNSVAACDHSGSQQNQQYSSAKKRRAASERIARIALQDLSKYFDLPILEASKSLKVGLTVLKKKFREFGIPRWPHRKIKSLDGLIHELQDVGWQRRDDETAATAVAKRRQMLEEEKESIERKPCMEIQSETKKFRQDIFKRRHRARAHKKQA